MFLDFYRLREQPFGVTPDPRYLYFSRAHREALASLFYGVEMRRGFLALVAEPGTGKTTLVFRLLENLRTSARTVFLFHTQCDSRELLQYVMTDLGFDTSGLDLVAMHEELNHYLSREMLGGRQFVLVIDEAQNLNESTLETVRLLSDFETPQTKLLNIILVGQPQLADKLASPALRQLRQRIGIVARLAPLTRRETAAYIAHRLKLAGYEGPPLFTRGALEVIADYSRGIPRTINNLCFGALSLGLTLRSKRIHFEFIQQAATDLGLEVPVSGATSGWRGEESERQSRVSSVFPVKLAEHQGMWQGASRVAALAVVFTLGGLVSVSLTQKGVGTPTTRDLPTLQPAGPEPDALSAQISQPSPDLPPDVSLSPAKFVAGSRVVSSASAQTIVVRPGLTIYQISREYFGGVDLEVIRQICALNPEIVNPNHLQIGQRIRLPSQAARQARKRDSWQNKR